MNAVKSSQLGKPDFGSFEFSLNGSLNLENSATKIFIITVKGFELTTSRVRDQDATTVPARHM